MKLKKSIWYILAALLLLAFVHYSSFLSPRYHQQLKHIHDGLPEVDFDESMQRAHYISFLQKYSLMPHYQFFKELFNKHMPQVMALHEKPRIPKKIHQIWLGSSLPKRFQQWQNTWRTYHPGWQYKLWTDKDVEAFKMHNKKYFDQASNYGEKSDIWRYEILERHGGLYVDMDGECYQSFDILHHLYDFYAGLEPLDTTALYVGNAFIGAAPHHPLIQALIHGIPRQCAQGYQDTVAKTGPFFFTDTIAKNIDPHHRHDVVFPATYFFPMSYTAKKQDVALNKQTSSLKNTKTQPWKKPESFAVHHYAASWM